MMNCLTQSYQGSSYSMLFYFVIFVSNITVCWFTVKTRSHMPHAVGQGILGH